MTSCKLDRYNSFFVFRVNLDIVKANVLLVQFAKEIAMIFHPYIMTSSRKYAETFPLSLHTLSAYMIDPSDRVKLFIVITYQLHLH